MHPLETVFRKYRRKFESTAELSTNILLAICALRKFESTAELSTNILLAICALRCVYAPDDESTIFTEGSAN